MPLMAYTFFTTEEGEEEPDTNGDNDEDKYDNKIRRKSNCVDLGHLFRHLFIII